MQPDPIVEEVRKIRDEYAKRFNYDLDAICQDLQEGSLWIAGSCSQNAFNEAFKERFAPFSHVMHEFKKAQI